jgi:hypothetical protein
MLGAATLQTATGLVVGAFSPTDEGAAPPEAYRAAFACLAAVLVVAVLAYARARDVRPSDEAAAAARAG